MALSYWKSPPDSWLLAWAIWRFRNSPAGQRPTGVPSEIPKYAWEFLKWCGWKRKGAPPPRPDITPKIPQWGWSLLKQLNIAVPLIPPPPPPPPPTWVNSWTLPNPIALTAWGWTTDSNFRNVDPIANIMFDAGIKTVALQIGQFSPDVPDRLRAFGFKIALWGRADSGDAQALINAKADGYIPQIEGPYEWIAAINNLNAGVGSNLSRSIVTTLAGLETYINLSDGSQSTEEVEELKSLGITHAWVECYKQDGDGTVHFPISKMMWSAKRRGIPYANPLIGLYWDVPVSTYQPDLAVFGRQIGCYTAETMRPIDYFDLKNL